MRAIELNRRALVTTTVEFFDTEEGKRLSLIIQGFQRISGVIYGKVIGDTGSQSLYCGNGLLVDGNNGKILAVLYKTESRETSVHKYNLLGSCGLILRLYDGFLNSEDLTMISIKTSFKRHVMRDLKANGCLFETTNKQSEMLDTVTDVTVLPKRETIQELNDYKKIIVDGLGHKYY